MKTLALVCGMIACTWPAASQYAIRGVVEGPDGAIPGATVQLQATGHAAVAESDGTFVLEKVEPGNYDMEVRSLGYMPVTRKVEVRAADQYIPIKLQENALTIDEVVVTGTMQPTFVSKSPVKIEVITSEYMNNFMPAAASSVVEGISLVNGVQEVVACGVCFTNSISINGLPGPYTAVLMDGTPMYGNLASVYGLNGIPSMIIDRIEVIKGPNSTLYGSEAVAGVINIITRDPAEQPGISLDVMGTTHREFFTNVSAAPQVGKSNGFIGVNYAYINDFDDVNDDGFGDLVNLDRVSVFSKWDIHRPSGKQFTISGKYYYEDRRNGVEDFLVDRNYQTLRGNDSIYGESIYTHRIEFFGTYELPAVSHVKVDYSVSMHSQNSFYGADFYAAEQQIYFANLIWNNRLGRHDLVAGLTTRYQTYDDNTVATEFNGASAPDRQYIPGVFIQDEWEVSDNFTILGGTRLDHYTEHGMIFSPRLNMKYKPGKWTTLRSNFGTGFRIVNLFTEDHAFVTGQREVVINGELQPEESYNFSFNLNHVYTLGSGQGMFDLDAYYTYFTNKITPDYETAGQIIYQNTSGHAESMGLSMNVQHQFRIPFSLNLGLNVQQVTETEEGVKRDIEFAPAWSGVFTANYQIKPWDLRIGYTAQLTGPMSLPEVYDLDDSGVPLPQSRPTRSSWWSLHHLQLTKPLSGGLSVYGGIQNIFNYIQPWSPLTGFNDPGTSPGFSDQFDTAYAYSPIHGREFYLGVTWEWD